MGMGTGYSGKPQGSLCHSLALSHSTYTSTAAWIQNPMETQARVCTKCNSHLENVFSFIQPPNILALSFPQSNLHINAEFLMKVENNDYQYILRGIIYFGADHFTSRIITDQTLIWYHDGMETAANVEYEGTIGNIQDLNTCRGKTAIAAIYTLLIAAGWCHEILFSSFFSDPYMPCAAMAHTNKYLDCHHLDPSHTQRYHS